MTTELQTWGSEARKQTSGVSRQVPNRGCWARAPVPPTRAQPGYDSHWLGEAHRRPKILEAVDSLEAKCLLKKGSASRRLHRAEEGRETLQGPSPCKGSAPVV